MPRLSVVITCYNYGRYLEQSLQSVLQQTFTGFDVVVIDDGSDDSTPEIMEKYASDKRIAYVRQENQGQPKAKNRGILESRGDFIAFLDADDIWMPTKLEKQVTLFDDLAVGVVHSRRIWINEHGDEIGEDKRTIKSGNILDHIFVDNFICFSSSVVRRSMLEEVGYFDENLPMGIDYDLWIRMASRCEFTYVDEPLVKYRTGHANLSKNTLKRYDCAQRIMRKTLLDPEIKNRFSWYVPRLAWADTWSNMAVYMAATGDRMEAWRYFGKACMMLPIYPQLWKRMLKCLIRR